MFQDPLNTDFKQERNKMRKAQTIKQNLPNETLAIIRHTKLLDFFNKCYLILH